MKRIILGLLEVKAILAVKIQEMRNWILIRYQMSKY
jgi:hypothetical protein